MKAYLFAIIMAFGLISAPAMAEHHTLGDKIVEGSIGDDNPGIDLEPMIGAAVGAAIGGGTGSIALSVVGATVGDVVDHDEIDLFTMIGAGVGTAVGGPAGAAVGAMLGDLFSDYIVPHKVATTQ